MRNGDGWHGVYDRTKSCITRLGSMLDFYSVKPYYMILLEYTGDGNFKTEIFDHDVVEINYPLRPIGFKKPQLCGSNTLIGEEGIEQSTTIDIEKMASKFFYNAQSNSKVTYDVTIETEHLSKSDMIQVFRNEGVSKLGLNDEMSWMELSMWGGKWVINLKWENGILFFKEDWKVFTKVVNLREGDILVFARCSHLQRFKVYFLGNKYSTDFQSKGVAGRNSKMKCLKMVGDDMLEGTDLELPRKFISTMAGFLRNQVKLIVGDGNEYPVSFCCVSNSLYGLKDFFSAYTVTANFFISFSYVGESTLYVTIYSPSCMDICNGIPKKLLLKDVRKMLGEKPNLVCYSTDESSDDSSDDSSSGDASQSSDDSSLHSVAHNTDHSHHTEKRARTMQRNCGYSGNGTSFTVTLLKSHVDQRGHGVYFPRHMNTIYRTWKKATFLTLYYGQGRWEVALLGNKKNCRFGLGWNDFTFDNKFVIGNKLQFVYDGNCVLKVFLLE
ncbi:hypothetical protein POM88_052354 [Heracleum sosnowskyi]|uniref:TF-B3 domain-containing protein n=1 Tax=Heracleum sosnowskyi TaxID=360622 RepID=A0AAD8GS34_9APIA|nr:hypothetical protein POM88_052354 [Heracleum sosnowskyi]